ncbi:DEAD/DEAH box helicase [Candidatus Peregrinibacteria bacterium]|nr:DEAD/DEAH box helicase [Candidatus Peregrinibacteria bacterium]
MNEPLQKAPEGFEALGVSPVFLHVLEQRGIRTPTPIQHQAIPALMQGKDIVGIAQTGTGKTLAYGLPLLQKLVAGKGRALIVVPTRELAAQVGDSLSGFGQKVGIRIAVFVGGASMGLQRQMIRQDPRILVATPGRLIDHIKQKTITLREVNTFILDEADQMFDMGFKPQIDEIIRHVPKERQTMLFSATMPKEILALATANMQLPLRIEVAPAGTAAEKVEQELFIVNKQDKMRLLQALLKEYTGTVLVFSRTKHGAKKIAAGVRAMGHQAAEIHANRSLPQRKEALLGFKTGKYRVLVATDIAARGIHVSGIQLVVNFDLPNDPNDYVHRIGRTARAGKEGKAVSFGMPDQRNLIRSIERIVRSSLPVKTLPNLPPHAPHTAVSLDDRQRGFRSPYPSRHSSQGGFHRGSRSGSHRSSSRGNFRGRRRNSR